MDADDRALFERSIRHAAETATTPAAFDAALDELGWADALDVDRRAAVSVLFEQQGVVGAASSALGHVVAAALGLDASANSGIVLPALGQTVPPGVVVGDRCDIAGLALGTLPLPGQADTTVVALRGDEHVVLRVDTADLGLRPVAGLDPGLGLVEVTGAGVGPAASSGLTPAAWDDAVAAGQLAVAHELVGAARAMLDLACDHARGRVQFGRPIAAFQAVRHRMAEGLLAIEAAAATLDAAWDDGSPQSAALAKAVAGRSARTTARHAQQVLAGIGYTTEHPLHLSMRRTLVLDQLLGSSRALTRQLGDDIVRTRALPALLPL